MDIQTYKATCENVREARNENLGYVGIRAGIVHYKNKLYKQ